MTRINMHTKYTPTIFILIIISVIACTLLVFSRIYYWQVIDFFALPFFETSDLDYINVPYYGYIEVSLTFEHMYSVVMQHLNSLRSQVLDIFINVFSYDINAPFIALVAVVFTSCFFYVLVDYKNKAAYLPLLICLSSSVIFTSVTPQVTIEQVANAMVTENDYQDPEVNYYDLLKNGEYSELDEHFKDVEKNFSTNAIGEYQYIDEYMIFKDAMESDLIYFDEWLKKTSNKKVVLISRGLLYENLGWEARGREFSSTTSDEQFSEMRKYFSKGVKDHYAVLDISSKSLLSYASLLTMASTYDFDEDKEVLFKLGITEFPSSFYLANKYMHKLQPKWGGSFRQIRSVAVHMREQSVNNPMLISLGKHELTYRARQLKGDLDDSEMMRLKRFAMFYGATDNEALNLALYYDGRNDSKNAINTLSQGLKFKPGNAKLLVNRAKLYILNDNVTSATDDMDNIVPADINDAWISDTAATVYDKLLQPRKTIPFYIRSIELDPRSEYPYNRLYWLSHKKFIGYKEVLPYMKKWTEMDPVSSDAWISYAATLKEIDPLSSIPAYRKFIKYANKANSIDMTAVKYAEKLIKKLESKE